MNSKRMKRKKPTLNQGLDTKLRKDFESYQRLVTDTEEWILFLTSAPSNPETSKRFPMTPSDLFRTRKRIKVETISESLEEDEAGPMPEPQPQPAELVRRGSRTASKLASMKMKEPNLITKLRRPSSSIHELDCTNETMPEAPPSKRARKGKSVMPNADTSSATVESSFSSALDSLTSRVSRRNKDEPMDTGDDIILEKVHSTKISTYDNLTKTSSLHMETVTLTRSSKRVTKQHITTVINSPAGSIATRKTSTRKTSTRKTSTRKRTMDMFSDNSTLDTSDDDNIPIIHFVPQPAKLKKTERFLGESPHNVDPICNAGNAKRGTSCTPIHGLVPAIQLQAIDHPLSRNVYSDHPQTAVPSSVKVSTIANRVVQETCELDAAGLESTDGNKTLAETQVCGTSNAEDVSIPNALIVEKSSEKKLEKSKPKPLNNATNRNTPEANKNMINRNCEPVSVKKRIEALEQKLIVNPDKATKPDLPVRITRTRTRAMMAQSDETSLPVKKATQKIETSHLIKLARKSLMRATKVSLAKERKEAELQRSVTKENTSPPRNTTKLRLPQSTRSTSNKNGATQLGFVHPSRLVAEMASSKQPMVNLNANMTSFVTKSKVLSASEEAETKRREERRLRRENKEDAILKKRALMEDKIEQQRKKREEKERNVLLQRALLEQEKAENINRVEKENEERARQAQEREENLKKEILRKKEEAKQKAAKNEERRVRKEEERIQALKLQEEEQQRVQAQKKKEQEDAERLHAKRMLEEKERKEKDKEAALKLEKEKQKQAKKVASAKVVDSTFVVDKPAVLIPSSEYDYPLPDVSMGNDSDYSEADEEAVPRWAKRDNILKTSKSYCIPGKALLAFFGSKPTTLDLNKIFTNRMFKLARSSSAVWKSPPRSSMLPNGF